MNDDDIRRIATRLRHHQQQLDRSGYDRDVAARVAGALLDLAEQIERETEAPKRVGSEDPTPLPEKQPYEKPELVEFGDVRDLTRGAGTKGLDALPVGTRHG